MRTPPKGAWANFTTECVHCGGEITVTNGRPERHECRERIDLDAITFPGPHERTS